MNNFLINHYGLNNLFSEHKNLIIEKEKNKLYSQHTSPKNISKKMAIFSTLSFLFVLLMIFGYLNIMSSVMDMTSKNITSDGPVGISDIIDLLNQYFVFLISVAVVFQISAYGYFSYKIYKIEKTHKEIKDIIQSKEKVLDEQISFKEIEITQEIQKIYETKGISEVKTLISSKEIPDFLRKKFA